MGRNLKSYERYADLVPQIIEGNINNIYNLTRVVPDEEDGWAREEYLHGVNVILDNEKEVHGILSPEFYSKLNGNPQGYRVTFYAVLNKEGEFFHPYLIKAKKIKREKTPIPIAEFNLNKNQTENEIAEFDMSEERDVKKI